MINWKIRLKNPSFWASVVIAVFAPILAYMGITARDLTSWTAVWGVLKEAALNPYVLLMVIVSAYNAVVDPTSTGVSDSARAISYDKPNGEKL